MLGCGLSGLGACEFLRWRGDETYIYDDSPFKEQSLLVLAELQVLIVTSLEHPIFQDIDLTLVLSPGIPSDHKIIAGIWARGRTPIILSELELALPTYSGKIIAVTGTNGKSTTVMMITHLFQQLGLRAAAAGNVGVSVSSLLTKTPHPDFLVVEVSSYQLEHSTAIKPDIAIFTSFSHDHIARHKTLENYFLSKWKLFQWQKKGSLALFASSVVEILPRFGVSTIELHAKVELVEAHKFAEFGKRIGLSSHNLLNASFAVESLTFLTGKPIHLLFEKLENFKTLPFRFEKIGLLHRKEVINDSKSTNVDSTLRALENIEGTCILFLGGLGKKESFTPISQFKDRISSIVAFGQDAEKIKSELSPLIPVDSYPSLKAFTAELPLKINGFHDKILFSPACASLDEFLNFEDRGSFFNRSITPFLDK